MTITMTTTPSRYEGGGWKGGKRGVAGHGYECVCACAQRQSLNNGGNGETVLEGLRWRGGGCCPRTKRPLMSPKTLVVPSKYIGGMGWESLKFSS